MIWVINSVSVENANVFNLFANQMRSVSKVRWRGNAMQQKARRLILFNAMNQGFFRAGFLVSNSRGKFNQSVRIVASILKYYLEVDVVNCNRWYRAPGRGKKQDGKLLFSAVAQFIFTSPTLSISPLLQAPRMPSHAALRCII